MSYPSGPADSVETALADHVSGKSTYTPPTWYAGLSTAEPSADDGTGFTEPSAGGYARQALTPATWNAATGGDPSSTSYSEPIRFAATGGWGVITHIGLFSVATVSTGLPLWWGTVTNLDVQTNDTMVV